MKLTIYNKLTGKKIQTKKINKNSTWKEMADFFKTATEAVKRGELNKQS